MKLVVYDAEIQNAIPTKGEPRLDGIRYCESWGDKAGMGIAVIGAYVWEEGYRIFMADNVQAFRELVEHPETRLVGFNNRAFDDLLLQACLGVTVPERRSWDLLRAVRVARGDSPGYFAGGPNLDKLCKANFLPGKSGSGADAPVLWQRGKVGQVTDYVLNDVSMTVRLVELVLAGRLRDHESGRVLPVPLPTAEEPP